MINGLHGEVERHELDDRLQPAHRCANTKAGKAIFGDRRVHHALVAELVQQALRHLVGALILRHFLAHHEDGLVGAHLLGHGVAQCLADGLLARRPVEGRHIGRCHVLGCRRFHLHLRRRARLGRLLRAGNWRGRRARRLFALHCNHGNHGAHLHTVGSGRNLQAHHRPGLVRFQLHRGLVGLDLSDHLARLHRVTRLHQPGRKRPLLHRGGHRRQLHMHQ